MGRSSRGGTSKGLEVGEFEGLLTTESRDISEVPERRGHPGRRGHVCSLVSALGIGLLRQACESGQGRAEDPQGGWRQAWGGGPAPWGGAPRSPCRRPFLYPAAGTLPVQSSRGASLCARDWASASTSGSPCLCPRVAQAPLSRPPGGHRPPETMGSLNGNQHAAPGTGCPWPCCPGSGTAVQPAPVNPPRPPPCQGPALCTLPEPGRRPASLDPHGPPRVPGRPRLSRTHPPGTERVLLQGGRAGSVFNRSNYQKNVLRNQPRSTGAVPSAVPAGGLEKRGP